MWATTETVAGTIAFDPVTLRTLGTVKYADGLRGDLTTAHPQRLTGGDLVNFLSVPGVGFSLYRQAPRAAGAAAVPPRRPLASVPHHRPLSPAWIHDFPGSNAHVVIPETPLYFNLGSLMTGKETGHIFTDWRPEDGARLHVVSLDGGARRTFTAPPFFAFHWANAHESADGRYLHIDAAVYDDPEIVNHLRLRHARAGAAAGPALPRSALRRLTLDLEAADGAAVAGGWEPLVEDEASHGHFIEFPTVAPSRKGAAYRYAWATCARRPTNLNNALAKIDTQEKRCAVWHEAGVIVGEPTFVARPGAAEEDDGAVLSVIVQADGAAALLVLDGRTHEEVARAVLPHALPNGFHGTFVAQ
jgi:carlactone synthase/all-trans-10'-apo-beta-carotenal 13,14-cleaving dioxygenase